MRRKTQFTFQNKKLRPLFDSKKGVKMFKSKLDRGSELCEDISISTSDITLTANGFKPAGLTPAE